MEKLNYFKSGIALLGTIVTWLFGAWDTALGILILFMVLDYITGLIKGYIAKELSSDIGLHGLARKSVILIVLIVAVALDRLLGKFTFHIVNIKHCFVFVVLENYLHLHST